MSLALLGPELLQPSSGRKTLGCHTFASRLRTTMSIYTYTYVPRTFDLRREQCVGFKGSVCDRKKVGVICFPRDDANPRIEIKSCLLWALAVFLVFGR